jgi:hypothetical protein
MRIRTSAFWLPKKGNSPDEYEDAVCPADAVEHDDADQFKCAVADGATETSFAALWANLLVQGYASELNLKDLRHEWQEQVHEKPLPWYAEEKVDSGAFAALIGLVISEDSTWKAEAIGDSCLFQIRDGKMLFSFPILLSEDFNNSPFLLSSSPSDTTADEGLPEKKDGDWQSGDQFVLMTDALSHWTLKRNEERGDAVEQLAAIEDKEAFEKFVDAQRRAVDDEGKSLMRNDDVTILRVQVD